jgi:4-hydroxybenzoate polyprenyltransferase
MKNLLILMRPNQWVKNGFVLTGLLFSTQGLSVPLILKTTVALISFILISSSIYIFNDLIDCEKDKNHPKKRNRPLANGRVGKRAAVYTSLLLALGAFWLSFSISETELAIVATYFIINIAYTLYLKHTVIIDVFCIATGFMLRILAGTIGIGIPPSRWLLLCSLFATLFLGFGKRRAEITTLDSHQEEHRKVLVNYNSTLLDQMIAICATGAIITYSLYTMSPDTIALHHTQNLIFTVPFVIYGVFRYLYLLHHWNLGGDPSQDLLNDKHILASAFAWATQTALIMLKPLALVG